MSPSKEALIHKWKTARHILAASLLGVSAITAGGAEAGSRFDRILQEVPTPVVVPEESVEEVEQEEQEPQSGIVATIPPTPVVLVNPTPENDILQALAADRRPNYGGYIQNMRNAQLEIAASLPEFTGQGYQTFTYNGEQLPFGMIDSGDINIYFQNPEQLDLSTHVVAVTGVERQTVEWRRVDGSLLSSDEFIFIALQSENLTLVLSYWVGNRNNVENVNVARNGDPSQVSRVRMSVTELEARFRQAMVNEEQVIVQFWNTLRVAGYQNLEWPAPLWEQIQSTANQELIDAIHNGEVSEQAGVQTPNTIIFLQ